MWTTSTSCSSGARATRALTRVEGVPQPDWIHTRSPERTTPRASAGVTQRLRYSPFQVILCRSKPVVRYARGRGILCDARHPLRGRKRAQFYFGTGREANRANPRNLLGLPARGVPVNLIRRRLPNSNLWARLIPVAA